ncbi:MAG TPA: NifB/NifX family molybdenum-iron cluster-binding protein [Bacteroidales bacterium]|nr:NifB/NifX family molybdenum-iron cluster-binding protein [Bacteroidales bacterium]HPI86618.1 NifB/NifX family molybdenum-iron cluster-binding protein [Bacteroidales bacterium]HPM93165.1 NifB/NifX family molybdenum-iron cluster-binding protein [Bacteroidales bacterium]
MMKIAVPVNRNGEVDGHFGHCEYYSIYTISSNGEIGLPEIIESVDGCGCKSNIASVLAAKGVKVMLAGGIGGGAVNVLNSEGIEVVRGCSGPSSELVKMFAAGKISDSGETCTHHHHHE